MVTYQKEVYERFNSFFATLISILDSQLSRKSSKLQITKWSQRVVSLLSGTGHLANHLTTSVFEGLYLVVSPLEVGMFDTGIRYYR